jgi:hypothetical protein
MHIRELAMIPLQDLIASILLCRRNLCRNFYVSARFLRTSDDLKISLDHPRPRTLHGFVAGSVAKVVTNVGIVAMHLF